MRRVALRLLPLLVAVVASGCISRPVKQVIHEDGPIDVYLRSDVRWIGGAVDKGYEHPVTIAPVRMAHILSRIDLRPTKKPLLSFEDEKDRVGAIHTDMLYTIAEGLSKALAQADADQEVVVMAVRETKQWGIFDHDFLTSLVAYVRDDRLYLHFSRHDWEIPRRSDRLPEPRPGDSGQRFRLITGTAMSLVADRSAAIDWRDPIFARPTRTRVLPTGEVVRSDVLMESPPEVDDLPEDPARRLPDDLSPQQLRDLADVEEARREGRITEAEYRSARRRILGGE